MIDKDAIMKKAIIKAALEAGFVRARILAARESPAFSFPAKDAAAPVQDAAAPAQDAAANYRPDSPSLLVTALPYGKDEAPPRRTPELAIAPFARRNYYREAVKRLQKLARDFRYRYGRENPEYALKRHYRVFCNSPVPEKPLAAACGLGVTGCNGLIITPEAGSLVIIAALTLPFPLEGDGPLTGEDGAYCEKCGPLPPCMAACPTGAVRGDGVISLEKCVQWYASGNGENVPPQVAANWGNRLYGCTACQDACVRNRRPVPAAASSEGPLPPFLNGGKLLKLSDEELKARFRGSALGLSWLGPAVIRRNIRTALGHDARGTRRR
ncbi:MAG: iron-sulfur protein [Treponema sp.]|jgi:epoxyqueuosine reductase|nr:iron-sulfur protein [Treponema sp.]